MSKRALFATFFGILLLTLAACDIGDFASRDEPSEPNDTPSIAIQVPSANQEPAANSVDTGAPSPTPVAIEGQLFLQLVEPAETEVFTDTGSLTVTGRTRVDAVVTINDSLVEPNIDGEFSLDVLLEEGPNIIEVVASVASGQQLDLVLVAIFLP